MPTGPRSVDNATQGAAPPDAAGEGVKRRRMSARDLALVASFTALIVVLGIPGAIDPVGSGVPITLQSLGVMLAGALLGARRGAAAVALMVALCAAGLPVLAGGRGGLGVFAGPTAGFVLGYIVAAAVIGYLTARRGDHPVLMTSFAVVFGGIVVLHAIGILGMMWRAQLTLPQALAADLIFVPGDLVKAVVAVTVTLAVQRAFPDLLPARGRRRDQ